MILFLSEWEGTKAMEQFAIYQNGRCVATATSEAQAKNLGLWLVSSGTSPMIQALGELPTLDAWRYDQEACDWVETALI